MKKQIWITVVVICVVAIASLIINQITAHPSQASSVKNAQVSADVMKIAKVSCVPCHAVPGNGMALARLNLTDWDKYSPEKQASKAKAMCKMITKKKMPPKGFLAKYPEGTITPEDLKIICDWAQSVQIVK